MTQDEVKAMFAYEPETGLLRRIDGGGHKPYPWHAGGGRDRRYLMFSHKGQSLYLHRLVWLYHYGDLPKMIDHRNDALPLDNRVENLRACSNAQNQYNGRRKSNNRSGAKGVVHHAHVALRPWQAKLQKGGRTFSLGYYATVAEASAAYAAGASLHAGEFARKN